MRWAAAARATDLHGIEVVAERAALAESRGVRVEPVDIMEGLGYDEGRFDAVVSRENLASWHNIGALVFG